MLVFSNTDCVRFTARVDQVFHFLEPVRLDGVTQSFHRGLEVSDLDLVLVLFVEHLERVLGRWSTSTVQSIDTLCKRKRLLDNSPTNQLAASQVAEWSTRGLVNSPTAIFFNHEKTILGLYLYAKPKPNQTPSLSTIETVQQSNLHL